MIGILRKIGSRKIKFSEKMVQFDVMPSAGGMTSSFNGQNEEAGSLPALYSWKMLCAIELSVISEVDS